MKVGFPYLKQTTAGGVIMDDTFHTCISFGIYDAKTEEFQLVSSEEIAASAESGLVGFFKSKGVFNLVAPECHAMAAKFFQDNKLNIFQALSTDLLENVMLLQNRMLLPFGADDVIASVCGSDCGACSTTCSSKV